MSCSSSYPSSSKHSSSQNEQRHNAITEQPNSVSLPLSCSPLGFIISTPFFRQPISSFPNLLSDASDQVRKSVLSNVDKCMKMLEKVASQNGFLESIISASSHLQNGFKIPRRRLLRDSTTQSNPNFAAILPGDSVAGLVVTNGILNFLNIYNTVLVVRLVLTWFPNAPPQVVSPLSTLCDPYLNIFRGIIPPLGGTLDLSPILAFLVLNAFTSAASALPAELPSSPTMASHHQHHLTASQQKWMMRLSGKNKADKIH